MTNEELDALEKRLREGVYSYRPGDPARAADAIAALRRELAAERERVSILAKEVAEWRSRPDALRADNVERERDAAITRAEKAELLNAEQARLIQETLSRADAAQAEARELREWCEALMRNVDFRLNARLCEMKPDHDDAITGFNDAWTIVGAAFQDAPLTRIDAALAGKGDSDE